MASNVDGLVTCVRRRLRLSLILRETFRYVTIFTLAAFAVSALSKFIHPLSPWQIHAAIIGLGIVTGVFTGLRTKITAVDAAMVADLRGRTGEKLSAYFASLDEPSSFDSLIKSNAYAAAAALKPEKLVPRHIPRTARFLFPLLLLVAGMFFVPEFKYPAQVARRRNILELEQTAKTLKRASELLKEVESPDPQIKELQREIDELRVKLKRGDVERKKALAEITKLSDELEKRLRETYTKKARMGKAIDELRKNKETSNLADAVKSGDRRKIGEEAAKVRKELEKLGNEMRSENAETREKARRKMDELRSALRGINRNAESRRGKDGLSDLDKALDALNEISLDEFGGNVPEGMLDEFEKYLSKGLSEMLDADSISKEDLEKMMQACEKMGDAKCAALGDMYARGMGASGRGRRSAMRLNKRLLSNMEGKMDPESFAGGGTTNLAGPKIGMKEGVTSDDLGTIGPNKATKFIQEYSSKLTEVTTDTSKVGGKMMPGEGIIGIETKGAPKVEKVVVGEFEKAILNLQAVAEDEVSKQNIPRKYREHVKKYFDSLRQ